MSETTPGQDQRPASQPVAGPGPATRQTAAGPGPATRQTAPGPSAAATQAGAPAGAAQRRQIRRWRRYLADEVQEAKTYRDLAARSTPVEREILMGLAEAEERHAKHWRRLLGGKAKDTPKRRISTDLLAFLARHFGFVFALAIAGRAETRTRYSRDPSVPASITADEQVHSEVIRGLAERGRARISGTFRAAVFGANDGLVSNLSLVLGMSGTGVSPKVVMATGLAGLLSGAMSMAAGEYVSVDSQRALLDASKPDPKTTHLLSALDINANELALVYRARGLTEAQAQAQAESVLSGQGAFSLPGAKHDSEVVGSGFKAATASFGFFSAGAIIPVIPFFFGLVGLQAAVLAAVLVGCGLAVTGMYSGILSGTSPLKRALRQVGIGWGAAAITYLLGLAFGTVVA